MRKPGTGLGGWGGPLSKWAPTNTSLRTHGSGVCSFTTCLRSSQTLSLFWALNGHFKEFILLDTNHRPVPGLSKMIRWSIGISTSNHFRESLLSACHIDLRWFIGISTSNLFRESLLSAYQICRPRTVSAFQPSLTGLPSPMH